MRLLLDTHVLLWYLSNSRRLGAEMLDTLSDPANDVWVSVVSHWEVAVKVRSGKLRLDVGEMVDATDRSRFRLLDIRRSHLLGLRTLPYFSDHRDPFDHLLIAQAVTEDLRFVTKDAYASRYPVQCLAC